MRDNTRGGWGATTDTTGQRGGGAGRAGGARGGLNQKGGEEGGERGGLSQKGGDEGHCASVRVGSGGGGDRERLIGRFGSVEARGKPGTVGLERAGEAADEGNGGKGGDDGTTFGDGGEDGTSMTALAIATEGLDTKLQCVN